MYHTHSPSGAPPASASQLTNPKNNERSVLADMRSFSGLLRTFTGYFSGALAAIRSTNSGENTTEKRERACETMLQSPSPTADHIGESSGKSQRSHKRLKMKVSETEPQQARNCLNSEASFDACNLLRSPVQCSTHRLNIGADFIENAELIRRLRNAVTAYENEHSDLITDLDHLDDHLRLLHNLTESSEEASANEVQSDELKDLERHNSSMLDRLETVEGVLKSYYSKLETLRRENELAIEKTLVKSQVIKGSDTVSEVRSQRSFNGVLDVGKNDPSMHTNSEKYCEFPETQVEYEKRKAIATLREAEEQLLQKQEEFDQWDEYYQRCLQGYLTAVEDGAEDATRTHFDLVLLGDEKAMTRELIEAEDSFGKALNHARLTGAVHEPSSIYGDRLSEGDRLSTAEAEWIAASLDRSRIDRWLQTLPHNGTSDVPLPITNPAEWEVKSVNFLATISQCSASFSMKRKIDRWDRIRIERWRTMVAEDPTIERDIIDKNQE